MTDLPALTTWLLAQLDADEAMLLEDDPRDITARVRADLEVKRGLVEWAQGVEYLRSVEDPRAPSEPLGEAVVRIMAEGYADRRTERAEGEPVAAPRSYEKWLAEQVEQHLPAGYMPVGSWARLRPVAAVQAAKAAVDAAPERLQVAVRAALEAGVSGPKLADALGVTKARIYQLRDGRR